MKPRGKGKIGGCEQRIRNCEAQLDNSAQACTMAPSLRGQRHAWRMVQYLLVRRNRLAQELTQLKTANPSA